MPCPPLCRICDEEDPEARFVSLEDCGHGLLDGVENNSVQLPECPRCKTSIRRNLS